MAQNAESVLRIVEIVLAIARSIVLAASIFVGVNIAFVAYNFATGNVAWGIVHLLLALAGLVFLAQIRQARRHHRSRQEKRRDISEKYHEAASA